MWPTYELSTSGIMFIQNLLLFKNVIYQLLGILSCNRAKPQEMPKLASLIGHICTFKTLQSICDTVRAGMRLQHKTHPNPPPSTGSPTHSN
jgi:hypothetical protein